MNREIYIDHGINVGVDGGGKKLKEMEAEDHLAIKIVMKMYSFESFLYSMVNRASRERDQSKIANLGPFAYLLTKTLQRFDPTINTDGYIFKKRALGFVTYRGLGLSK